MDRAVGGDPPGTAAGPDAGADPKCARCPARRPHHRCPNMPPARRPGLCHGLTSPAHPSALALPAVSNPAEASSAKPAVLAPPPGPAAPSRSTGPAPPPHVWLSHRNGPVLTSLRPGQLTVDPGCLPDRRGPLRSLRHHPRPNPGTASSPVKEPGSVGPRPRVSRAAGRPGLHLHELHDLRMCIRRYYGPSRCGRGEPVRRTRDKPGDQKRVTQRGQPLGRARA